MKNVSIFLLLHDLNIVTTFSTDNTDGIVYRDTDVCELTVRTADTDFAITLCMFVIGEVAKFI